MSNLKIKQNRQTRVSQQFNLSSLLTQVDMNSCQLVVQNGVDKGQTLLLQEKIKYIIGAGETVDFAIAESTISSEHAEVSLTKNGLHIIDLQSTNGCFYQKSKFTDITLPLGATVSLGRVELKILPIESEIKASVAEENHFSNIISHNYNMKSLFSLLKDVSLQQITILIEGETGTGKELVAKAIHEKSLRKEESFVVFDCASVPPEMIESALFGHLKGSGHGRQATRLGAFRNADGGTLFLDEIGDLPLSLQPKLLRVLEDQNIQMLGTDRYHKVDVRVVAATNKDLKKEVREKRFREDLFYRLAVIRMKLPPLRERLDDIQPLTEHFIQLFSTQKEKTKQINHYVEPSSYQILQSYDWPGNIRELKNLVQKAVSISSSEKLDLAYFLTSENDHFSTYIEQQKIFSSQKSYEESINSPLEGTSHEGIRKLLESATNAFSLPEQNSFKDLKANVVSAFEQRYFELLMNKNKGNISKAAQYAQMDRKHLRDLLKKHDLWRK